MTTEITFDEDKWLKIILLLNDTYNSLEEINRETIYQLPIHEKRKFRKKGYYLTVQALAHIFEKHYHKGKKYPMAAKFTVDVINILHLIRDAWNNHETPLHNTSNFKRIIEADIIIGKEIGGMETKIFTIITDGGGKILTAFPGLPNKTFTRD